MRAYGLKPQPAATGTQLLGFTLTELLVVITGSAVLACTVLMAAPKTAVDVQRVRCLTGKRQLCLAWRMYADDNAAKLVINLQGGATSGSWVSGWLDWTLSSDNTNTAFLIDPKYARLAPYVSADTNIFKCPADRYVSSVQASGGWTRRTRSVSASIGLGEGNAEAGPWVPLYKHAKKFSDLNYPTPAETFVFLDEHPDSINEGAFFSPQQTSWIDLPAAYHAGAAGLGFADSHVELHKWSASLSNLRASPSGAPTGLPVHLGDADLHWVSYHTSRVSSMSY